MSLVGALVYLFVVGCSSCWCCCGQGVLVAFVFCGVGFVGLVLALVGFGAGWLFCGLLRGFFGVGVLSCCDCVGLCALVLYWGCFFFFLVGFWCVFVVCGWGLGCFRVLGFRFVLVGCCWVVLWLVGLVFFGWCCVGGCGFLFFFFLGFIIWLSVCLCVVEFRLVAWVWVRGA